MRLKARDRWILIRGELRALRPCFSGSMDSFLTSFGWFLLLNQSIEAHHPLDLAADLGPQATQSGRSLGTSACTALLRSCSFPSAVSDSALRCLGPIALGIVLGGPPSQVS